ncbi:MAG: hypothetical protein F4181_00310 [Proteobacteria bacterium]|nr:hypothetical protein [Pseudomonadota bacterium]
MKPDRQQQTAPLKERIRLDAILTAVGLFISFSLLLTTQLNGMEERIGARIDSMETNFNERMDSMETNFNARFDSLEGRVDAAANRIRSGREGCALPIESVIFPYILTSLYW